MLFTLKYPASHERNVKLLDHLCAGYIFSEIDYAGKNGIIGEGNVILTENYKLTLINITYHVTSTQCM